MRISVRNTLKGIVTAIDAGLITSKGVIDSGNGNKIVSIISRGAIAYLKLEISKEAFAIAKSSEVMVSVEDKIII